jgi:hypothetical protein
MIDSSLFLINNFDDPTPSQEHYNCLRRCREVLTSRPLGRLCRFILDHGFRPLLLLTSVLMSSLVVYPKMQGNANHSTHRWWASRREDSCNAELFVAPDDEIIDATSQSDQS